MVGQSSGEQCYDMFDKEMRKHTECCKISIHKHIIGNICELSTEEEHKKLKWDYWNSLTCPKSHVLSQD